MAAGTGLLCLSKTEEAPDVEAHRVRRVTIACDQEERVQFDGEDGGTLRELSVELVPKVVYVMV